MGFKNANLNVPDTGGFWAYFVNFHYKILHFVKQKVYKKAIFLITNTLYKYEREKTKNQKERKTT